MSVQQLGLGAAAARTSQADHQPACATTPRASLPAFPDSAPALSEDQQEQQEGVNELPLPDHFPEPHTPDPMAHTPALATTNPAQCLSHHHQLHHHHHHHAVKNSTATSDAGNAGQGQGQGQDEEAKEGLRRITDKYAAPALLQVNGSACSSDAFSPSVSPVETWPASPSPSTALSSASPTPSGLSSSPVMNGGDPSGTPRSCLQSSSGRQNGSAQHGRLAPLSISAFSDASSDMSDASPSPALTGSVRSGSVSGKGGVLGVGSGRYQSVSGISLSTSLGDGVKEEDVQQVEMFYRSHKTEVTVCRSLANLYFGSVNNNNTAASSNTSPPGSSSPNGRISPHSRGDLWEFVTTGIPVLVLDSGDHLRSRQLSIVVAEKGTGFVLWKDVVSHLTGYACLHANFHTLRISSDSSKLAGLSFDDCKAAADFAAAMLKLTSDPDDELLMLSKKGKKKKKKKQQQEGKKSKFRPPKKSDISQPCCFQHVTKLERPQITGLTPLPPNGFPPPPGGGGGGSVSSLSDVFQDRLTVSTSRARSPSSEFSDASVEH